MRALGVIVLLATATHAVAETNTVIDLDKDENADWRLAEAAGACNKRHPAFIKTWCHTKIARSARFTQRYEAKAQDAGAGKLTVKLSVDEHGKGFVSSILRPQINCRMDGCTPEHAITVLIRTKAKAADVRVVTVAFDVSGMWRDRQWWGPKPAKIAVTLWDATGAQLGDGTVVGRR